jgi:hypothetical protein
MMAKVLFRERVPVNSVKFAETVNPVVELASFAPPMM